MDIVLRPCNGEAELSDPAVTGVFAAQMAQLAATVQVPPWCGYIGWVGARPMGFGGFVAPPDPKGTVEIGYLTFPQSEGTGTATAIAGGVVAIARSNGARQVWPIRCRAKVRRRAFWSATSSAGLATRSMPTRGWCGAGS